jgi:carbonic anhydrase
MPRFSNATALKWLRDGNQRFLERVEADEHRPADLVRGQDPEAVVLGCADSRVPPEIVFDVGLGELFVIRVAGGVANTASIASVEYAVTQLGTRLVVVLAHEKCGAVSAAIQGGDAGRNLNRLMEYIEPAVQRCREGDVNDVARMNAKLNAERLVAESEILREAAASGDLRIATAFHRFTTGAVEFD